MQRRQARRRGRLAVRVPRFTVEAPRPEPRLRPGSRRPRSPAAVRRRAPDRGADKAVGREMAAGDLGGRSPEGSPAFRQEPRLAAGEQRAPQDRPERLRDTGAPSRAAMCWATASACWVARPPCLTGKSVASPAA